MKKFTYTKYKKFVFPVILLTVLLLTFTLVKAQTKNKQNSRNGEKSIIVTAVPHSDKTRAIAESLQPTDFAVTENKVAQKIISVKRAEEEPVVLAVLIQDDLVSRVNNELDEIRDFIRELPDGSQVMVGYVTAGTLQVRQSFTTDKESAAKSLRVLFSSTSATPYNPYVEVVEALKMFDAVMKGRRMILMISDGLDTSNGLRFGSPFLSADLDRAIAEAQRRSVAVFTIYAPSVGLTGISRRAANYGQGSLNRLSDETGGEAFFSGMDFVTFDPYFREYNELLKFQWLITYRSTITGKGFRRIQVETDFDIHLHHPAGYDSK